MGMHHRRGGVLGGLSRSAARVFAARRGFAAPAPGAVGRWFEPLEPRQLLAGTPTPLGPEFPLHPGPAGEQTMPVVAAASGGSFVAAFLDGGTIRAQRYDAEGTAQGSPVAVNTRSQPTQDPLAIAIGHDGGFVVAWAGSTGASDPVSGLPDTDVFARRFAGDGTPLDGAEFVAHGSTAGIQTRPAVDMDADGDFVVAWLQGEDKLITFRGGSPRIVEEYLDPALAFAKSRVVLDPGSTFDDGRFITANAVYARRFAAAGAALDAAPLRVDAPDARPDQASSATTVAVAMDDDGEFTVAWGADVLKPVSERVASRKAAHPQTHPYTDQYVPLYTIYYAYDRVELGRGGSAAQFRRYTKETVRQGTQVVETGRVLGGAQTSVVSLTDGRSTLPAVALASDSDGDFVVAWQVDTSRTRTFTVPAGEYTPAYAYLYDVPTGSTVQAARYTGRGARSGGVVTVAATALNANTGRVDTAGGLAVDMDSDGDFTVAWSLRPQYPYVYNPAKLGDGGASETFQAQRFTAGGARDGAAFQVNDDTTDRLRSPSVALDDNANLVFAWASRGDAGSDAKARLFAPPKANLEGAFGAIRIGTTDLGRTSLVPGDRVRVPLSVLNTGQAAAAGKVTFKLYLSADGSFDPDAGEAPDTLVATLANQAINLAAPAANRPPASRAFTFDWLVTTATPPGDYTLFAVIDAPGGDAPGAGGAIPETSEADNAVALAAPVRIAWSFGQIDDFRSGVKLVTRDADGTEGTWSMSGAGRGDLTPEGVLSFADTDLNSAASLATRKVGASDDAVTLTGVRVVEGSLKDLKAPKADVSGAIVVDRSLGAATLRNFTGTLEIAGGQGTPAALTFADATDASITTTEGLASLKADSWTDTDDGENPDLITAAWLGGLTVKRDFQAGLHLTGSDAPKGVALGRSSIGGGLGQAEWTIDTGATAALDVKGLTDGWRLAAGGDLAGLTLAAVGDATLEVAGSIAGAVRAKSWATGALHAASLKSLEITGGDLGASVGLTDAAAKTNVSVKGAFSGAAFRTAGSIGTAAFGAMFDALLFAGIDPTLAGIATADDFIGAQTIDRLTINGLAGQPATAASFVGSNVAAAVLKSVTLKVVDPGGGEPFGVIARQSVGGYRRGTVSRSNLTLAGVFDSLGDFQAAIV